MRILDNIIALRIAYLLITPIEQTDAYKLGLIDKDGKTIKKATTAAESNATSMLHRLCWNIKRLIGLVPGGSTRIGSLAATYLLMKEAYENEWSENDLNEAFVLRFNELCEAECSELDALLDKIYSLEEDAPVNAAGAGTSPNMELPPSKSLGLAKRKKFKTIDLPA